MFIEDTDFVIIVFEIQNYINTTLYVENWGAGVTHYLPKWPK